MSNKVEMEFLTKAGSESLLGYVLAPGESFFTDAIPLDAFEPNGLFTLFANVNGGGDGLLTVAPYGSVTGSDDDYAPGADYIPIDGFSATSGDDEDGRVNVPVVLSVCRRLKFKVSNPHETESLIITKLVFGWQ